MAHLDVAAVLAQAGVRNIREGQKEITGSCPMHQQRVGKSDAHASWSMNRHTFVHHCFSCGYAGTLTGLLIDLQGYAPDDIETMVKASTLASNIKKIEQKQEEPERRAATEWEMANVLTDVPERLLSLRHLSLEAANTYGVRWDSTLRSWVLPIRDPQGTLLGAQYRQKGNVLNLPQGLEKSVTLFGFCEMRHHNRVALVESPLDAVRLYGLGIPAVSSFGAWVSPTQVELLARNFTSVVMMLDNDKAGKEATAHTAEALRRRGTVAIPFSYRGMDAKDPGDVEDDSMLLANWEWSLSNLRFIAPPPKKMKR